MNKKKNHCDLSSCFLCKLCTSDWNPAIGVHKKTYQFKKGALIFREGDPVTGIYFVFEGTVKVHKDWGPDKELLIRFARKGDIVGHRGLGKDSFYPVSATAITPVSICFVPMDFFQSSLKVNQNLLYQLMMFYARELQDSEKKMRNLAHMPVKGRLIHALLDLQERFGTDADGAINLELSRQDLASFIGTAYETAFRFLNELKHEQLIVVHGKKIVIAQKEMLEKMIRK